MNGQIQKTQDARRKTQDTKGFSLIEVLMAVGTLAIGMLFIAGVFPVSIHFTTVSSERTIAATVADEAFAKIKLYSGYLSAPSDVNQSPFDLPPALVGEYAYPSTPTTDPVSKKYWWSAICRRVGPAEVQVTVFVSRKAGVTSTYLTPSGATDSVRPVAVPIGFNPVLPTPTYELALSLANRMFISDGYTIVDNVSGQICRVLDRTDDLTGGVIKIDRPWNDAAGGSMWVVPPPVIVTGTQIIPNGRYPCIAVYQKVMRF